MYVLGLSPNCLALVLGTGLIVGCQKDPLLFLLLDDSSLSLSVNQKRILSAALTAAKKVILKLWLVGSNYPS